MKKWQLLAGAGAFALGLYLLNERLSRQPTQYIQGGAAATSQAGEQTPRAELSVGFLPVT